MGIVCSIWQQYFYVFLNNCINALLIITNDDRSGVRGYQNRSSLIIYAVKLIMAVLVRRYPD